MHFLICMSSISRRTILKLLGTGGLLTASGSVFTSLMSKAYAQSADPIFPTIFIHARGGWDPATLFDARTGLVNRKVDQSDIDEINLRPDGLGQEQRLRWYRPTLTPLRPYLADCCIIRNLRTLSSHGTGYGLVWYGENLPGPALTATPWANYLASELLKRRRVAAPNWVVFVPGSDPTRTFPFPILHSNNSPDPRAAAQLVRHPGSFAANLRGGGSIPQDVQRRIFDTVDRFNGRLYNRQVQAKITDEFAAANAQANELLTLPVPPIWPPTQEYQDLFGYTDKPDDLDAQFALAYQVALHQVSHTVWIRNQSSYDTHRFHHGKHLYSSGIFMPRLANLLKALTDTESTVIPGQGLSMLDTTNVVVMSEMGRANRVETGEGLGDQGTPHWPWTQAICFGGHFKRGYLFGEWAQDLTGIPAHLDTGARNQGEVPTMKNLAATLLKANGVDPTGWTSARPINAILRGVV